MNILYKLEYENREASFRISYQSDKVERGEFCGLYNNVSIFSAARPAIRSNLVYLMGIDATRDTSFSYAIVSHTDIVSTSRGIEKFNKAYIC